MLRRYVEKREVQLHDGDKLPNSETGCIASSIHWLGRKVGPRTCLLILVKTTYPVENYITGL
jgi:hypothetical protein